MIRLWEQLTFTFDLKSYLVLSWYLAVASRTAAHRFVLPWDTRFNWICFAVYYIWTAHRSCSVYDSGVFRESRLIPTIVRLEIISKYSPLRLDRISKLVSQFLLPILGTFLCKLLAQFAVHRLAKFGWVLFARLHLRRLAMKWNAEFTEGG